MGDERESAWWGVHAGLDALPGWRVSAASFHAEEKPWPRWHVTAVDARNLGRRARHEALQGSGGTEVDALQDLRHLLEVRASH